MVVSFVEGSQQQPRHGAALVVKGGGTGNLPVSPPWWSATAGDEFAHIDTHIRIVIDVEIIRPAYLPRRTAVLRALRAAAAAAAAAPRTRTHAHALLFAPRRI
jgi:hypothetical protein